MSATAYLDGNADVPVLPAAWEAYREAAADYGNPSSRHALGRAAKERFDGARAAIAETLAVEIDEIVFVSGGTEADALALHGVLAGYEQPHVVSTTIEHAAIARGLDETERRGRVEVTRVAPNRSGRLDVGAVLAAMTDETRLVTVVAACNETGVLQPIEEIAHGCRDRGVTMHTDAVQAAAWSRLEADRWGPDLISISGHKLGAVGGIGVLVVRSGLELVPLVIGGGHEGGRRASTENVAGAASLAAALGSLPDADEVRAVCERRDRLEQLLTAALDELEVIGRGQPRLPNTSCIRLQGCAGDGIMMALDLDGIRISTGSACASGSVDPSPILLGLGLSADEARDTVRFSLTRETSDEEVERAARATIRAAVRMRRS